MLQPIPLACSATRSATLYRHGVQPCAAHSSTNSRTAPACRSGSPIGPPVVTATPLSTRNATAATSTPPSERNTYDCPGQVVMWASDEPEVTASNARTLARSEPAAGVVVRVKVASPAASTTDQNTVPVHSNSSVASWPWGRNAGSISPR